MAFKKISQNMLANNCEIKRTQLPFSFSSHLEVEIGKEKLQEIDLFSPTQTRFVSGLVFHTSDWLYPAYL